MFVLKGVEVKYPGGGEVLKGINAEFSDGVTVIVGPNAGGKTTLLRMMAGLMEKTKGEISLAKTGKNVGAGELRRLTRMVMQDAEPQILGATVEEDVELGKPASELAGDFDLAARGMCERFGLVDLWNEDVGTLSYGQKRKLCLVHALLAGPKALLLDEPFAGLDYPAAKELREFIRESRRGGLCLVVSTHELDPVFDLADQVIVVSKGLVAGYGKPGDIAPQLEKWAVRAPGKEW